ncbi:MAG: carboxypeptidase regulatory-like domain-containing protein [Acidobacteria bacterium]|nr:carboxypeptidase regulatory-like domain-containing protein [Acidobacteriota bacterium]
MHLVKNFIFGVCVVLAVSLVATAQTGSIAGTVADPTGAVVQGADVTVRNVGTNLTRTVASSGSGSYSVTDLPVGVYEVTVKKASFKVYRVPNLQLTVAQAITLNPVLEAGAASEEVQVRADQLPQVDLETAQVSNLVSQRQIQDMPLITRDPYSLVLLSPGTSQTNTSLGGITVNGSRERNNNFLLDGVDNNDTSVPGGIGGVLSANPDSTQEFRVITNNFNAEFGRNTGAIVDVVTKSGTNSLHGSAYWFGRYTAFGGARDWFNREPDPQDPYVRNQFGYAIGGPIRKDKTFFFFNQEFKRFRTTLTNAATVPTQGFKDGVFTYIDGDGNSVPVDLRPGSPQNPSNYILDPTMQSIFALYPNPAQSADGFTGTIFYPTGSQLNSYETVAKIDHHFNDKHVFTGRYGYDNASDPDPFHDALPFGGNAGATSSKSISQAATGSLSSTLTPNLVNVFSFGWNQIFAGFRCTGLDVLDSVSPVDQFGNGRDYNMDPFTSFGCLSLVSNGQFRKTGTTSYGDALTWVRGNHTFKFGGDFRNIRESGPTGFYSRRQIYTQNVSFYGPAGNPIDVAGSTSSLENAASALYGIIAEDLAAEYFNKDGVRQGSDNKNFRQHEYSWFGQDSWKVRRNLTLTLGVRYQLDGVPYEENANFSNLLTSPASYPVVMSIVGPGTGKQIYNTDYSNIEPRFGFSWDPWSDGKTAIRGGFGIFHDRVFGNLFGNARGNPPFEQDYVNYPFGMAMSDPEFPAVVPDTVPSLTIEDGALLAPVIFDPHFRNSSSNNWNFGIQRELTPDLSLDLAYVGSKGTHIYRQMDGNPPDPALVSQLVEYCSDPENEYGCSPTDVQSALLYYGGTYGYLPFNAVEHNALYQPFYQVSNGNSIYHSMQVKVTKAMKHGFSIQGSYTWAHGIDDSSDPLAPAANNRTYPRNSRDLRQDRGNSDNDIRHIAVINYTWELPFGKGRSFINSGVLGKVFEGMQFSGLISAQTGHPFEIRQAYDTQRTGVPAWADLVGDPFAPGDNPGVVFGKVYFTNPSAFAEPAWGGPGSVGRNQFYGPNYVNMDMTWLKNMNITERFSLQLRLEGYNILNHPQFQNPDNLIEDSIFGVSTATVGRSDGTTSSRQLQVALKLVF